MNDTQQELREKLAAIEHERWADWQRWVHSLMGTMGNQYVLDGEYIKRWNKQIATPYADLSDQEKASDMEQVDRYWPLIEQFITANRTALLDAVEGVIGKDVTHNKYCAIWDVPDHCDCGADAQHELQAEQRKRLATLRRQNGGFDGSSEPAKAVRNQVDNRGEFTEGSL